ncbi:DUF4012 domain-containing protein [bacterium]|nr:DUF4012 domain-containing protein [bacterium]
MKKTNKNQIIRQMFDIRPTIEDGSLDLEKIKNVKKIADSYYAKAKQKKLAYSKRGKNVKVGGELLVIKNIIPSREPKIFHLGKTYKTEEIPFLHYIKSDYFAGKLDTKKKNVKKFDFFKFFQSFRLAFNFKKTALSFGAMSVSLLLIIIGTSFLSRSLKIKSEVLGISQSAYENFSSAIDNVKSQNFVASSVEFSQAYENFSKASEYLNDMGSLLIESSKFFPYASQLSSGKKMLECGKHISLAGKYINDSAQAAYLLKNPDSHLNIEKISLLKISERVEKNVKLAEEELKKAQENISKIKISDLPKDKHSDFLELKAKLPFILTAIKDFSNNSHILADLLGRNGPRKYLFLFQNNQEMRATGGFIGTYGLLDISNGHIRKFFIDGIFNPDGQLKDKIVPPKPIQKISAAWSLHDSNWFPDFPMSAEKAIFFYEKTGGPTTDGVITFTPTVMQKLLEITGPIKMEDYGVVLDSENFIAKTQYKVEVDYDKEENRPKKILADLTPVVLDKLLNPGDMETISRTLSVLNQALSQKHILLYSRNKDLQKIISDLGWSGKILPASKDYLSVINTNINGYKTDGIVEEIIEHQAEIQVDGSVIDTVTITRKHNGGNSQYSWWNKVNADYMRIYVPLGSELLEAEGQTREFNKPPLDYGALKFKRDADVEKEENNMLVDEEAGTRIYQDAGKTVFANWVYVSPQETVTIKYKYLLPFKLEFNENKPADSYSLLVQKQSGSLGSRFSSAVKYPEDYKLEWSCSDELKNENGKLEFESDLETDKFMGVVFLEK